MIPPETSPRFGSTINGVYQGQTRIQLEHVNRIGLDAAPDWPAGTNDDVYRVDIEGTPSISQETAFRFTDGLDATRPPPDVGDRKAGAVLVVDEPSRAGHSMDLPVIAGATDRRCRPVTINWWPMRGMSRHG